jgi:hypothetical protein
MAAKNAGRAVEEAHTADKQSGGSYHAPSALSQAVPQVLAQLLCLPDEEECVHRKRAIADRLK